MKLKRLISLIFAMSFMISNIFAATVVYVQDMPTGWSQEAVQAALENGALTTENGYVRPTELLTRAELAAGINNVFGVTQKVDISEYTDVPMSAWYYNDMAKAVSIGLFSGYGNGLLKPEKNITRQELLAAIYNILELEVGDLEYLERFNDKDLISEWSREIVARMSQDKYVSGNAKGNVKPLDPVTREEFAQIIKNIFSDFCNETRIYTSVLKGNVVINKPGVTLKDCTVDGDIILADGVELGEVVLDNVKITGRILVRSGENLKILNSSKIDEEIIVNSSNNTVNVSIKDSEVKIINVKSNALINGNVNNIVVDEKSVVEVNGNVSEILVNSSSEIKVTAENVEKVIVNPTAEGTKIYGNGKVDTVIANADNVVITTEGTKVIAGINANGVKAGNKVVEGGTTEEVEKKSSGGGGGGGSSSSACTHSWNVTTEETCTTAAIETCSKCKKSRSLEKTFTHNWITQVEVGCETDEIKECEICGITQVGELALGHDYGGVKECIRCGKTLDEVCEHAFVVLSEANCTTSELLICQKCGERQNGKDKLEHVWETISPVSCETNEIIKCKNCSTTKYGELAPGHNWEITTVAACGVCEVQTCKSCKDTLIGDSLEHILVTKVETCEEDGTITCSRGCDYLEVIPKLGHNMIDVAPTCTEAGYSYCSRCDYKENGDFALGHNIQTVEATCTSDGVDICIRPECNYSKSLPRTGHNLQIVGTDCVVSGYKVCTNKNCDYEEHEVSHNIRKVEASCTKDGFEVCLNDSCAYYKILQASGEHVWDDWESATCTTAKYRVCLDCGIKEVEGVALGHSYDESGMCTVCGKLSAVVCSHDWKETIPATCTTAAIETCDKCDATRDGTGALQHEWVPKTAGTCTTVATEECNKCHEIKEVGTTLGHTWIIVEPNCIRTGYTYCDTCSDIKDMKSATGHLLNENNICKVCGETVCSHTDWETVTAATCTTAEIERCSVCKSEREGDPATGHTYQLILNATCTTAAIEECSKCDAVHKVGTPLEHNWITTSPAKCGIAAIETCSNCGETRSTGEVGKHNFVVTAPTCTEAGYSTCSICGIKEPGEIATGHSYGAEQAATCIKGSYKECSVCHYEEILSAPLGHDFSVITQQVTCTEDGEKKCSRCDETEVIKKSGHKLEIVGTDCTAVGYKVCTNGCDYEEHESEHVIQIVGTDCTAVGYKVCTNENCTHEEHESKHYIEVVEPTCTEDGAKECIRANCAHSEIISKLGHDWGEVIEPTCTEEGYTPCTRCDAQKDIVSELGHDISVITKPVTCTEDGEKKCSRCDESEVIEKLGHKLEIVGTDCTAEDFIQCTRDGCDYAEYETKHNLKVIESTCTEKGYEICVNEGCKTVNELDVLGHDWIYDDEDDYPNCTEGRYRTCQRDKCGISELVEAPLGHNFVNGKCTNSGCKEEISKDVCEHTWKSKDKATCTTPATQYCSICGTVEDVGEALGHKLGKAVKATCTTMGYTPCTRTGCGEKLQIIEATGHDFSNIVEPTCQSMGYTQCTKCQEKINMTPTVAHSFGDDGLCVWCKLALSDICVHVEYEILSLADCINAERRKCTTCDTEYDYGVALGHDFKVEQTATCTIIGTEKCSRCNIVQETGLEEHAWVTTTSATCSTSGRQTCNKCGATQIDPATANPSHTWDSEYDVEATCTEYGKHTCGVCGITEVDLSKKPLGHDFENGTILVPAYCETEGKVECSRCTSTKTLEAIGHNYDYYIDESYKPTCTTEGYISCSNDECSSMKVVEALGHTYESTVREGNCYMPPIYKCATCQSNYTGPAGDGHELYLYQAVTCSTLSIYKCSLCSYQTNGDETLLKHNKNDYVAATCQNVEQYKCSMCGQVQSQGTTFGDHTWDTVTEATCTVDGLEQCIVEGCGKTRAIDATGHQFTEGICGVCSEPETYVITFDAITNGGTLEGEPTLNKGNNGMSFEAEGIDLPTASKDGATFSGWYTASSGGEEIDADVVLSGTTANITLYAQFTE